MKILLSSRSTSGALSRFLRIIIIRNNSSRHQEPWSTFLKSTITRAYHRNTRQRHQKSYAQSDPETKCTYSGNNRYDHRRHSYQRTILSYHQQSRNFSWTREYLTQRTSVYWTSQTNLSNQRRSTSSANEWGEVKTKFLLFSKQLLVWLLLALFSYTHQYQSTGTPIRSRK